MSLDKHSFTLSHVTGEKRPVVFLHDAQAEIERLVALRDADAERHETAWRTMRGERDEARDETHRLRETFGLWVQVFNRLEAAITHHKRDKLNGVDTSDEVDEALWAARDKILKALNEPNVQAARQKLDQCDAVLWHGAGHQSSTRCRRTGEHEIHEAVYGGNTFAQWRGDEAMTGYFDEPPEIDEED